LLFETGKRCFGTGKPRHNLRPAARSKIRQMRPTPRKDAAPWHKSAVKETARLLFSIFSIATKRDAGEGERTEMILFPQPIA
jgi:hypothetical protein